MDDPVDQAAIFGPFLATMLLTLVVWIYMYIRRIRFITANRISSRELAAPGRLAALTPPAVSNPSDNLKNLFETPVVFYALSLYLYVTHGVDDLHVGCAWVFFCFRALHSAVHCTFNLVLLRFWMYALSSLALWTMLVRASLAFF